MKHSVPWGSARITVIAACISYGAYGAYGAWGTVHAQDSVPVEILLQSCAVCHGEQGSAPGEEWPNLAGQQYEYMVGEMQAYRDGSRENTEMAALSAPLSDGEIERLARFYADTQKPEISFDNLSAGGQAGRNAAATCLGCHGMEGLAVTPVWPNLAGQTRSYLEAQIKAFRDGTREDPVMSSLAKNLSDDDIENIAIFFSELGSW